MAQCCQIKSLTKLYNGIYSCMNHQISLVKTYLVLYISLVVTFLDPGTKCTDAMNKESNQCSVQSTHYYCEVQNDKPCF